jgi:hypothetical protein
VDAVPRETRHRLSARIQNESEIQEHDDERPSWRSDEERTDAAAPTPGADEA